MEILYSIFVFLHVVGAAMIVGIWIGNMKKPTVHPRQFDGAMLQLVTGVIMMGLIPAMPDDFTDPNYVKLGIKLVIGLVVGVLAFIGRRKYKANEPISGGLAHAVGGLALLNIALATLWN
jgi:Na+-translocating ferredoxin:NAD+ oxidoreductase RnfD subunit